MAGSALAFDANRIGLNQVLAIKTDPHGSSGMPRTRSYDQPAQPGGTA
jgi:cyclopropane-fatty-acyl-phospholipid synthase